MKVDSVFFKTAFIAAQFIHEGSKQGAPLSKTLSSTSCSLKGLKMSQKKKKVNLIFLSISCSKLQLFTLGQRQWFYLTHLTLKNFEKLKFRKHNKRKNQGFLNQNLNQPKHLANFSPLGKWKPFNQPIKPTSKLMLCFLIFKINVIFCCYVFVVMVYYLFDKKCIFKVSV